MNGKAIGKQAKHAVADLAFGKEVTVQTHGKDKYTRTLGDVILPDGMNVNQEHVKQGWCSVVSEVRAIRYHAGEVGGRSEGSETWAVG